ncbi:la-related protein 1B isoform X2 [Raphanus sativus]|uniref:La-related protein 1B isoform X2 n=1 Tax=Raphanus sativus TaxID=3726 RepID=A0A9W3CGI3_RAPSA|nr:la-related protein 1B isoform X2 [Raphanus sativus]
MATTESRGANSESQIPPGYSSGAINDASISLKDPFFPPPCDNDKKPVWNKPCTSSSPPLMGADSWPALSLSSHKSPSLDSSKGLSDGSASSMPQAPLSLSSSSTAATSSDNHNVNGQRKPFRRNNSTSSSTSNPPNTDQNHTQRSGSATTQSRHSHRHRSNGSSYPPPGDGLHHGNRRNFDQSSFRNSNGRGDMHLQPPQSGFGMMRPQMLMGSPSNAQYMTAPQIGSYGGPVIYPEYDLHVFLPHPPPESMTLVGNFLPPPIYFPSFDPILYNKILTQVEYYFSADNLSKDKYLRGQMNDEGWVPVRIIAGFRRLAEMTDNIQTILEALRSSQVVEVKNVDGICRVKQ